MGIVRLICSALVLFCALGLPRAARAAFPATATLAPASEPLLVPIGGPGMLELSGLTLTIELSCAAGPCRMDAAGAYRLHNRDRAQAATVQLTLSGTAPKDATSQPTLRDASGGVIEPMAATTEGWPVWQVTFPSDGHRTLVLNHALAAQGETLLAWECDSGTLAAWGTVESLSIAWNLSEYLTEGAFADIQPSHYVFDGYRLYWEYEHPAELTLHRLVIQSPVAYRQAQAQLVAGEWSAWLQHQQRLAEALQALGLTPPNLTAASLAALRAQVGPVENVAARLTLAHYLRGLAAADATLRVNYDVLAAREIEAALAQQPDHAEANALLKTTYLEIADAASQQNDLAGALYYLRKANALAADVGDGTRPEDKDLALRWALTLAERGQVSQALVELGDQISPQMREEMLHYAPPFASAHTQVTLSAQQREITYTLRLYPPSAADTVARVQALAARVQGLEGWQASVGLPAAGEDVARLHLLLPYDNLHGLNTSAQALVAALAADDDLLGALVAAPWQGKIRTRWSLQTPWFARLTYAEQVELAPLATLWQDRADYVRWRQIELRNPDAPVALGEQERELAVYALREQEQIWAQIPSGTSWTYSLVADELPAKPRSDWMVRWGQSRVITLDQPLFQPLVIGRTLVLVGAAILVLALLTMRRRGA